MTSPSPKLELQTCVACAKEGNFVPIAVTTATSIVVTMGTAIEDIEGRGVVIDDFIDALLPLANVGGHFVCAEKWLTEIRLSTRDLNEESSQR
jgi:hypothetical protein